MRARRRSFLGALLGFLIAPAVGLAQAPGGNTDGTEILPRALVQSPDGYEYVEVEIDGRMVALWGPAADAFMDTWAEQIPWVSSWQRHGSWWVDATGKTASAAVYAIDGESPQATVARGVALDDALLAAGWLPYQHSGMSAGPGGGIASMTSWCTKPEFDPQGRPITKWRKIETFRRNGESFKGWKKRHDETLDAMEDDDWTTDVQPPPPPPDQ